MAQTSTEESKAVMRRHMEAGNERDRAKFIECFSPEAIPHGVELEEFVEIEFSWFDAFPDLEYSMHEVFGEGELVAGRWTFHGTHTEIGGPGPIKTIEPTHEEVEVTGINIGRVRDGKFVEYTGEWSVHELLDALGLSSLPEE